MRIVARSMNYEPIYFSVTEVLNPTTFVQLSRPVLETCQIDTQIWAEQQLKNNRDEIFIRFT